MHILRSLACYTSHTSPIPVYPDLRVHHLIDFDMKEWKRSFINEVIAAGDILKILSLKISKTWRRNCYCWEYAKSGIFTVRAGYEVVVQLRQNHATRLISEPIIKPLKKKSVEPEVIKEDQIFSLESFIWICSIGK